MENFSFKCSKIVKNALYLKKSARTVTHECQKVNSGDIYFFCPIRTRVKCYLFVWQILSTDSDSHFSMIVKGLYICKITETVRTLTFAFRFRNSTNSRGKIETTCG